MPGVCHCQEHCVLLAMNKLGQPPRDREHLLCLGQRKVTRSGLCGDLLRAPA
jgi:hypothetical protein